MSDLNGNLSGSGTLSGRLGGGGAPAQDVYWDDILNKPNFATVATSGSYNDLINKPNLANVATSGSYNDLTDKPTIPAAQVNADWNATSGVAEILNKPTIPPAQVNADWNAASGVAEILNKPNLANVATSGSYNDLTDKPTIPAAQVNADWNAASGVAEILNKPTIPAAQVNADWNATSGVAEILNKPTIPTTASQIDYDNTTSGLQADDVQDAITELKSNLMQLPESGSNANGNYMKFPDGTLICTKTVTDTVTYSAWGSWYESSVISLGDFAETFISVPIVTLSLNNSSTAASVGGANPTTTSAGNTRCFRPNAGTATNTVTIGVIAVGRWKN